MIALIATDLDGTFLGADKLPSAENTEPCSLLQMPAYTSSSPPDVLTAG
ncbi:hydrolase [Cutibacterium acnes JCM 18909]|nr:hydrolase [Cutibacterium acnes JCM 18909]